MPTALYTGIATTNTEASSISVMYKFDNKSLRSYYITKYKRQVIFYHYQCQDSFMPISSTIRFVYKLPAILKKNSGDFKRLLNISTKQRLIDFIESSINVRRIIFEELTIYQGIAYLTRTITRYLKQASFRRYLVISKLQLTNIQKEARLQQIIKYVLQNTINQSRIIFINKLVIQNRGTKRLFITRRVSEKFLFNYLRSKFRKPTYYIVQKAITNNKREPLLIQNKKNLGNITLREFIDYILPINIYKSNLNSR